MDEIIPQEEWGGIIEPCYPKGKRGRSPMGIEKMLRMYLLRIWFNLFDQATEDAIRYLNLLKENTQFRCKENWEL